MSNLLATVKADGQSAAYRVAANQTAKGVRSGILRFMENRGSTGKRLKAISELLETDIGEAFISMGLGYGMTYAPGMNKISHAPELARELRIEGMAKAGNVAMDEVMGMVLPAVMGTLSALPDIVEEKRHEQRVENILNMVDSTPSEVNASSQVADAKVAK